MPLTANLARRDKATNFVAGCFLVFFPQKNLGSVALFSGDDFQLSMNFPVVSNANDPKRAVIETRDGG